MTSAQWHRVRELFEQAVDRDPSDASAWIAREAADESLYLRAERQQRAHTVRQLGNERVDLFDGEDPLHR